MTLPTIDTHEFARRGDSASGRLSVVVLDRLGSMLIPAETGSLDWELAGRSDLAPDGSRQAYLRLAFTGSVVMRCVRCLEPVPIELAVERDYRMVANEAQAEREDVDEDDHDLLVSSRQLDLQALIEDEAIMALPLAPSHEDCSPPEASPEPEVPSDKPAPFAALAALRERGGPGGSA
jgi:uncharacterized protein